MADIPDTAQRARQMYCDGVPVTRIMKLTGLTLTSFYFWIDGAPQAEGGRLLPALPYRRPSINNKTIARQRALLVARLLRANEKQVQDIEQRLFGGAPAGDPEADARALGMIARTLRELSAIQAMHGETKRKKPAAHDEPVPRDLGELRRALAEKIDRLAAEAADEDSDGA